MIIGINKEMMLTSINNQLDTSWSCKLFCSSHHCAGNIRYFDIWYFDILAYYLLLRPYTCSTVHWPVNYTDAGLQNQNRLNWIIEFKNMILVIGINQETILKSINKQLNASWLCQHIYHTYQCGGIILSLWNIFW